MTTQQAAEGCQLVVAKPLLAHHGRNDPDHQTLTIAHTFRAEGVPMAAALTANYGKQLDNSDTNGGPPNLLYGFDARRSYAAPEGLSPTITASGGSFGAPCVAGSAFGARRLIPVECERLQGFPDCWTGDNNESDSARYRQLGNAVAVPCAEWLGRRIRHAA